VPSAWEQRSSAIMKRQGQNGQGARREGARTYRSIALIAPNDQKLLRNTCRFLILQKWKKYRQTQTRGFMPAGHTLVSHFTLHCHSPLPQNGPPQDDARHCRGRGVHARGPRVVRFNSLNPKPYIHARGPRVARFKTLNPQPSTLKTLNPKPKPYTTLWKCHEVLWAPLAW
jgi:hypothetical protein